MKRRRRAIYVLGKYDRERERKGKWIVISLQVYIPYGYYMRKWWGRIPSPVGRFFSSSSKTPRLPRRLPWPDRTKALQTHHLPPKKIYNCMTKKKKSENWKRRSPKTNCYIRTHRYFPRPRHWLSTLYSCHRDCRRRPCPEWKTTRFFSNNKK